MKTAILILMLAASPPEPNDIPMEYDPNSCAGPVMDWAYCAPNVSIIYAVEFYTQSGRPASALDVTLGGGEIVDVSVIYDGKFKDPDGPGFYHRWQIGYTPRAEGIHHINIKASYGKKSYFQFPWTIPPGQNETDSRTILLNVTAGDRPYIRPSLYPPMPVARLKEAYGAWVRLGKQQTMTKPTTVLR